MIDVESRCVVYKQNVMFFLVSTDLLVIHCADQPSVRRLLRRVSSHPSKEVRRKPAC